MTFRYSLIAAGAAVGPAGRPGAPQTLDSRHVDVGYYASGHPATVTLDDALRALQQAATAAESLPSPERDQHALVGCAGHDVADEHVVDDGVVAVVAVLAERHFAQEKIPQRVDPVGVSQCKWIDDVADGF